MPFIKPSSATLQQREIKAKFKNNEIGPVDYARQMFELELKKIRDARKH